MDVGSDIMDCIELLGPFESSDPECFLGDIGLANICSDTPEASSVNLPSTPSASENDSSFRSENMDCGQSYQDSTVLEETTLSIGILAHLEQLEKRISEMKTFLRRGFHNKEQLISLGIERLRLRTRTQNFNNITELCEPFELLLRADGQVSGKCPQNGDALKRLSHQDIDELLDDYDIPFKPSMFLHEKQLLYLRFIGANRAIMHRVVD